jgi:hypothetical protein
VGRAHLYSRAVDGRTDNHLRLHGRLGKPLADCAAPPWLHLVTDLPRLDEGGLEELDDWVAIHPDPEAVFIDTLKMVRPRASGCEGIYDADYETLEPLVPLAAEHRVAIVVEVQVMGRERYTIPNKPPTEADLDVRGAQANPNNRECREGHFDGHSEQDVRSDYDRHVEERMADCIHGYPHGKGCYECDPDHPYRKSGA